MANYIITTRRPRGQSKKGILGRFWERVMLDPISGCWLWTGGCGKSGHGRFYVNGKLTYAYRVSYEIYVGPIQDGLEIDHLCRIPRCVNPAHLEPVTHAENVRRGDAGKRTTEVQRQKTHCPHGHPYIPENIYYRKNGYRDCKTCVKNSVRKYQINNPPKLTDEQREKRLAYGREYMKKKRALIKILKAQA